jgi:peptide/nickel transport system substrate-binding protein
VTYVYALREGVTFSDGSPLTPKDVTYTFGLHSAEDSSSFMARYMAGIESVEATGDREVTVKLSAPDPEWPYTIARIGIVSAAHHDILHGCAVD